MLWDLFLTFFKMGAVTFGGGYAMLPILQREVAENKKWSTEEELMDYFAIGQCTPGMIAVNVATFVGYKQKGFSGGHLRCHYSFHAYYYCYCHISFQLCSKSVCHPCFRRHPCLRMRLDF